jgi:DNA repair protein RecO (recombination protein O)
MEWTDEGIILGVRRHGETSTIVELMTPMRGRHLGLVRGGVSRRIKPYLQPGNSVRATWRARLDEHLGNYTIEGTALRADRLMASAVASYCMQTLAALLRLLPERDQHLALYDALSLIVDHLDEPSLAAPLLVRFELQLLAELGFGLELGECAATGEANELVYVSPKSGRAVSRLAGEPWKTQLLVLPGFLNGHGAQTTAEDIVAGFTLTEFFLMRRVLGPRGMTMPESRASFVSTVARIDAIQG